MRSDPSENEIASVIVDACYHIHSDFGPGLLESVYNIILWKELRERGLNAEKQVPIPLIWKDIKFDEAFRADLVVNDKVLVELKSVEEITKLHWKQLHTYLKLTDKRLGLLVNFGQTKIKNNILRVANDLSE